MAEYSQHFEASGPEAFGVEQFRGYAPDLEEQIAARDLLQTEVAAVYDRYDSYVSEAANVLPLSCATPEGAAQFVLTRGNEGELFTGLRASFLPAGGEGQKYYYDSPTTEERGVIRMPSLDINTAYPELSQQLGATSPETLEAHVLAQDIIPRTQLEMLYSQPEFVGEDEAVQLANFLQQAEPQPIPAHVLTTMAGNRIRARAMMVDQTIPLDESQSAAEKFTQHVKYHLELPGVVDADGVLRKRSQTPNNRVRVAVGQNLEGDASPVVRMIVDHRLNNEERMQLTQVFQARAKADPRVSEQMAQQLKRQLSEVPLVTMQTELVYGIADDGTLACGFVERVSDAAGRLFPVVQATPTRVNRQEEQMLHHFLRKPTVAE
jgi:hypothetical protein